MSDLAPIHNSYDVLLPPNADKDTLYRMTRYLDWLDDHGLHWWHVNLAAYRDFLFNSYGLKASTVSAHLSTIRGRYSDILRSPVAKAEMYQFAQRKLRQEGVEPNPGNLKAVVDELRATIIDATHPSAATVSIDTDQDPTHTRLTVPQANRLIASIDDLRDKAMVSLALATGLRVAELCAVKVSDLYDRMDDGALALRVWRGKGNHHRKVPYGEHEAVLDVIERWLDFACIDTGRVFPVTTRTVQRRLELYPVCVGNEWVTVQSHDLRRTYARRLYEAGVPVEGIRQNLGHTRVETTLHYIGELDSQHRQPPAVFRFE